MAGNVQIHTTITLDLESEIWDLANKEDRSFSQMAAILLQNAVKERNRRKKNSPVPDYTSDQRAGNSVGFGVLSNSGKQAHAGRLKKKASAGKV